MKIEKIDGRQFKILLEAEREFIAIFSTQWCGFCRTLTSELSKSDFALKTVEVDISDEDDCMWDDFGISMVPTAILFREGKEVARKPPTYDGLRGKDIKVLAEKSRAWL